MSDEIAQDLSGDWLSRAARIARDLCDNPDLVCAGHVDGALEKESRATALALLAKFSLA
jgi:hypothetical protein